MLSEVPQTITSSASFVGVTVTLGVLVTVEAGRGEVKVKEKVGKAEVLMGRETVGRSGNSGT